MHRSASSLLAGVLGTAGLVVPQIMNGIFLESKGHTGLNSPVMMGLMSANVVVVLAGIAGLVLTKDRTNRPKEMAGYLTAAATMPAALLVIIATMDATMLGLIAILAVLPVITVAWLIFFGYSDRRVQRRSNDASSSAKQAA